jgi:hypothetical protein
MDNDNGAPRCTGYDTLLLYADVVAMKRAGGDASVSTISDSDDDGMGRYSSSYISLSTRRCEVLSNVLLDTSNPESKVV